ncbi:hypothetical protein [Mucilaginibacter aquaedulcis]|uniref:hypothetical protein n=1 Tax=Mucilaginibacter aquaedulcis TaxID=1187081 RepID=UPI0025B596DD|nr:hypothetical protein [Mucilaginibacter aquaedulcis]MDN3546948.1 hypothetical protein [Mucilaginibacter aquaedulcis]
MIELIFPYLIPYLLLAAIAGLFGIRTRIGFWGVFILSILVSPIISLIVLFFLKEKPRSVEKIS